MTKKKSKRVKRQPGERLRAYTHDFPVGDGKTFKIRDVPHDIFNRARERARIEQRSLRWIVIRLLDRYGKGEVTP